MKDIQEKMKHSSGKVIKMAALKNNSQYVFDDHFHQLHEQLMLRKFFENIKILIDSV